MNLRKPIATPVNRLEFLNQDFVVLYKERKNGEEKNATIKEIYNQIGDKEVWFKLCTIDKYGNPVYEWRPCKLGIFALMDITYDK